MLTPVTVTLTLLTLALGVSQQIPIERIAGGGDADIVDYPYALQIHYYDDYICGGTLVSYKFALTAAHCVYGRELEVLVIRAGTTTLGEGGQEFSVEEIIYHPKFVYEFNIYDAVLLLLSESVSQPNIQPILDLASDDSLITEGASITLLGWGWNHSYWEYDYVGFMNTLQVVDLPVLGDQICQKIYGSEFFNESLFCAGDTLGYGLGFCNGDNGGPAIVNGILVGIISYGEGCAERAHPGVYVRVSKVRDFVESIINE